jgi:hypothetical protein
VPSTLHARQRQWHLTKAQGLDALMASELGRLSPARSCLGDTALGLRGIRPADPRLGSSQWSAASDDENDQLRPHLVGQWLAWSDLRHPNCEPWPR